MRRRRFRTLASQITVLAGVPTAVVLLAVAGLSLFLNQHSRLDTLLQTDAALAAALAAPAARAVEQGVLSRAGGGAGSPLALRGLVATLRPGAPDALDQIFGAELAVAARATAAAARRDRPAVSDVVSGPAGVGPVVLTAALRSFGLVDVAALGVLPDISGLAWHAAVRGVLPDAPGVELALVDGTGVVAYHDDPARMTLRIAPNSATSGAPFGTADGSLLRSDPDGSQRITGFAPLGTSGWYLVTERTWHAWNEAFRGFGLVLLAPLLLAAALPPLLIALSATRATRPVRQLTRAARRISAGDFRPFRINLRTGDELDALAGEFGAMANQLESLYGSWERQVSVRTAELQSVVDLARAVSSSLQADRIVEIADAELVRHPEVLDAHVWLDERTTQALGLTRPAPTWLPLDPLLEAAAAPEFGSELGTLALEPGADPGVWAVPMRLREERAALVVRGADGPPSRELERFLFAVSAQVAIALDNARLYRRGQTTAALEERTRLAREIHDTLAQTLTGVIVHLEAVQHSGADAGAGADHLARARELARVGLREARRSVQGLRASALDGRTVDQALEAAVARLDKGGVVQARFTLHGDALIVPTPIAAELYRIGEEALTNIVRHAGASHVLLNLYVSDEAARLVVEDDGGGISNADGARGYGLIGMRERAQRLGGRLLLESEPGEGTRVEATIPLRNSPAGEGQGLE